MVEVEIMSWNHVNSYTCYTRKVKRKIAVLVN